MLIHLCWLPWHCIMDSHIHNRRVLPGSAYDAFKSNVLPTLTISCLINHATATSPPPTTHEKRLVTFKLELIVHTCKFFLVQFSYTCVYFSVTAVMANTVVGNNAAYSLEYLDHKSLESTSSMLECKNFHKRLFQAPSDRHIYSVRFYVAPVR